MGDDDRPSYLDREKKSHSELDRMRRERRDGGVASQKPADAARAKRATEEALKQADGLFSSGGNAERARLAAALLDARGTPALADACRAYREAAGPPTQLRQISCFLDADAPDVLLMGLDAVRAARAAQTLDVTAGLRTQLRMLAAHVDDAVAEEAEALVEEL
jgi:hypothetical protein